MELVPPWGSRDGMSDQVCDKSCVPGRTSGATCLSPQHLLSPLKYLPSIFRTSCDHSTSGTIFFFLKLTQNFPQNSPSSGIKTICHVPTTESEVPLGGGQVRNAQSQDPPLQVRTGLHPVPSEPPQLSKCLPVSWGGLKSARSHVGSQVPPASSRAPNLENTN